LKVPEKKQEKKKQEIFQKRNPSPGIGQTQGKGKENFTKTSFVNLKFKNSLMYCIIFVSVSYFKVLILCCSRVLSLIF